MLPAFCCRISMTANFPLHRLTSLGDQRGEWRWLAHSSFPELDGFQTCAAFSDFQVVLLGEASIASVVVPCSKQVLVLQPDAMGRFNRLIDRIEGPIYNTDDAFTSDPNPDFVVNFRTYATWTELHTSLAGDSYQRQLGYADSNADQIHTFDLNADGIDEVLVHARNAGTTILHQYDGEWLSQPLARGQGFAAADVNADGLLDLLSVSRLAQTELYVRWGEPFDLGTQLATQPFLLRGESQPLQIDVQAPPQSRQYVHAWMDLNQDGHWSQQEKLVDGQPVGGSGQLQLQVTIPSTAELGDTWVRVRVSDAAEMNPDGPATSGDVEDYEVVVLASGALDFGDAPSSGQSGRLSSYPTTLADNGARHLPGGPRFSSVVISEADGRPTEDAAGEELAEGTQVESTELMPAMREYFRFNHFGEAGSINAWIDLNQDGDWDDPDEQFVQSRYVSESRSQVYLEFRVPHYLAGKTTFARFRFSSIAQLDADGLAPDGGVIDLQVEIAESHLTGPPSIIIGSPGDSSQPRLLGSSPLELSLVLDTSPPSGPVVATLETNGIEGLEIVPSTLEFDSSNWQQPQKITVGTTSEFAWPANQSISLTLALRDEQGMVLDEHPFDVATLAATAEIPPDAELVVDSNQVVAAGAEWSNGAVVVENDSAYRTLVRRDETIRIKGPALWQNPLNLFDVNQSGQVSPADALAVINEIARRGDQDRTLGIPTAAQVQKFSFFDVTGDQSVSPLDALRVINYLARKDQSNAELTTGSAAMGEHPLASDDDDHDRYQLIDQTLQLLF